MKIPPTLGSSTHRPRASGGGFVGSRRFVAGDMHIAMYDMYMNNSDKQFPASIVENCTALFLYISMTNDLLSMKPRSSLERRRRVLGLIVGRVTVIRQPSTSSGEICGKPFLFCPLSRIHPLLTRPHVQGLDKGITTRTVTSFSPTKMTIFCNSYSCQIR